MEQHRCIAPFDVKVESAAQPFSCFNFVERHYGDFVPLRRCFSLGRSFNFKTLVIENIPPAGLVKEENAEISSYFADHEMKGLQRLSFWKSSFRSKRAIASRNDAELVGYAIVKRDVLLTKSRDRWHVFDAVFRKYPHPHNCVPNGKRYSVSINGIKFSVPGVLYCQQNELNKSCAHVALRSLLSRLVPEGDISYREMNKLAGQATTEPYSPSQGLSIRQIRAILQSYDLPFRDIDYDSQNGLSDIRRTHPYQKFLYAGVESGSGALLGFTLTGAGGYESGKHIIPFYGHTFNKDTWAPDAEYSYFDIGGGIGYIPSESWTSSFLGHDDNFGPNFCIPRLYVRPDQVSYVVELLKPRATFSGVQAEAIALKFLYSLEPGLKSASNVWLRRLRDHVKDKRVVFRAICLEKNTYIDHLLNADDWENNREPAGIGGILKTLLPDLVWMVEVSVPQLFPANEHKLGEIILNAGVASKVVASVGPELFVMARLPSRYFFPAEVAGKGTGLLSMPSRLTSHVSVIAYAGAD